MRLLFATALVALAPDQVLAQQREADQAAQDLAAQTSDRLTEAGTWRFSATARDAAGRSVCEETWAFSDNGTLVVHSGSERVDKRWRVRIDAGGLRWLHTTSLASNGAPDCQGNVSDPAIYPRGESGMVLLFFNSGDALTCQEPDRVQGPEGQVVQAWGPHTCWGSLAPTAMAEDQRANADQWRFTEHGQPPSPAE